MDRKTSLLLGASLFIIGVGGLILTGMSEKAKPPKADPEVGLSRNASSAPSNGQYLVYEPGIIEKAEGTKLLFFHAPWCSQCQQIEASINELGVPAGVSIIKIDYDTNHELRKQYGVTLQTTFVRVDDDGKELKKYVAYNQPHIDSVKRELLQR